MVSYWMLFRVIIVRTTRRNIPEDTILQCQHLRVEDIAWSTQRILTAANLGVPDRSRYFFSIQVAPQLPSRG
jgi:hypothetical protein